MNPPRRTSKHEERLAEWLREYGPAVRGYVLALTRRPDVADDLVQDVFRRAWEARERYAEAGAARAYLLKIADRLVCDRSRRSQREQTVEAEQWEQLEPAGRESEPALQLEQNETQRQLQTALASLTPVQQRVLLLRYYGSLEFAEIAVATGCPLNTVLSHCRRGLLALRKLLVENVS